MTIPATPTSEETKNRVRTALRSRFGDDIDTAGDDDALPDVLGDRYDSLAALEAISSIEAEFGIEVDFVGDDVRYSFATVARIVKFVDDYLEDRISLGRV